MVNPVADVHMDSRNLVIGVCVCAFGANRVAPMSYSLHGAYGAVVQTDTLLTTQALPTPPVVAAADSSAGADGILTAIHAFLLRAWRVDIWRVGHRRGAIHGASRGRFCYVDNCVADTDAPLYVIFRVERQRRCGSSRSERNAAKEAEIKGSAGQKRERRR